MVNTVDFVPFGTGVGANVLSQANYLISGYAAGFAAGSVASSAQVGKAVRQATFVAAALSSFISDKTVSDVLDDGDLAGYKTKLGAAILANIPASGVLTFNGRSGVVTLTNGDVLTALGNTPIFVNTNAGGVLTGPFGALAYVTGSVTNSALATMPANRVKANLTGGVAAPQDVTIAALATALGIGAMIQGGNGMFTVPGIVGGVPATVIVQWGFLSCGDDSLNPVSFPVAFPTSCDWIAGGVFSSFVIGSGNGGGFYAKIIDRFSAVVGMAFAGGTSGQGVYWIAIGH